jgi:tetratricopeptide (TPR) repeat protein
MTEREKFRTRGQYYLFSRNPGKAIEELTALVEKVSAPTPPAWATWLLRMPYCVSSTRRWRSAHAPRRCSRRNPLRQSNVALYAMYAGKFDEAIAGGKKVVELNKDYAMAWVSQGLASEALGKYDDAAAAYKQLSTIAGSQGRAALGMADRGDAARPHQRRGCRARADADPETAGTAEGARAEHTGRRAARTGPRARGAEARRWRPWLEHGPHHALRSRPDFCRRGARTAREGNGAELDKSLVPDTQALGMTLRGEIQLIEGDVRGAVATFVQSLKTSDTWMTRYLLGRAYVQAGEYQDADREFDNCERRKGEATAIYIDDVPTWRLIAPLYYYTGTARAALKRSTAADSFRTFVELKRDGDEKSALVADAEKRLAQ